MMNEEFVRRVVRLAHETWEAHDAAWQNFDDSVEVFYSSSLDSIMASHSRDFTVEEISKVKNALDDMIGHIDEYETFMDGWKEEQARILTKDVIVHAMKEA